MTVARYDGRQWVPLMTGAISDFTPLPSGEVPCQMGLGGSLQKSDGTTIALPPSLSNNVQKHFLTVDRDGRILFAFHLQRDPTGVAGVGENPGDSSIIEVEGIPLAATVIRLGLHIDGLRGDGF